MWAIPTGASWLLKKKKNQVRSPSPESRVPETGSDPPIGSGRESGRDMFYEVYPGLTGLIRDLYGSYGSYSCAKVPVGTMSRNRSGSYHLQGQIRYKVISDFYRYGH